MDEVKNELLKESGGLSETAHRVCLEKYFTGQSKILRFGKQSNAWSGIINPCHSGVTVYLETFSITNFGEKSIVAEIWMNAQQPFGATKYSSVISTNQVEASSVRPKAWMMHADYLGNDFFDEGVNIFDRIILPDSTVDSISYLGLNYNWSGKELFHPPEIFF